MQVHKETIDKIPNALPNRNNVDIEIYGMEGIPEGDLRQHDMSKGVPEPAMVYPDPPKVPTLPPKLPTTTLPLIHTPIGFGLPPNPHHHPHHAPPPYMPPGMMPMVPGMNPYGMPTNSQSPPMPPPLPGAGFPPPTTTQVSGQPISAPPAVASSVAPPPPPPKPLFPSVAASNPSLTSTSSLVKTASTSNSTSSHGTIATITANTRIIHPEEDLSLEELRTRLPRYKHLQLETGTVSSSSTTTMGSSQQVNVQVQPPLSGTYGNVANLAAAPSYTQPQTQAGPPPFLPQVYQQPQAFRPAY